jgi:hypothetical protein
MIMDDGSSFLQPLLAADAESEQGGMQESEMLEDLHSRLMDVQAFNRRLSDMIAFEEACVNKLKRAMGISTLLFKSPWDRLSSVAVKLQPCCAGSMASDIERECAQMLTRLQSELRKKAQLERDVYDAQNMSALLTDHLTNQAPP